MTDYKKLSELYADLENLSRMQRDVSEAKENLQTKDHIFSLDISPRCNSRSLMGSKIKYRKELIFIIESEIKEVQGIISRLSSEK